jgi:hypothetical protein
MPSDYRKDWKAIQWNYDVIFEYSDEVECPYLLSEREVQALLTFMDFMGWVTRWHSTVGTPVDQDAVKALRDNLVDKLLRQDDCPSDPCEDGCTDYLPNLSFIRYEPNDPFRTPLLVPPGYTIIPWYTNPAIPLPGVIPTDAMVNQLSVAAPALPLSGFPRFSFEFDGRGEVEIELVNVPAGGFCVIVLDENPVGFKVVNTSSNILDILSLAGLLAALGFDTEDANVVDTDIVEWDVEDVGHHRIDVTFLPNIGGETLLGFGGGLRRVTLCGPDMAGGEMYLQRANPEDPCLIEQSVDGGETWTEAWRMDNCCNDGSTLTRIVNYIVEESTDGGETWTPVDDDPRFVGITLPPRTGENAKCDAAQSTVDMISTHFTELAASVGLGASVTALVAAIVAIAAIVVSLGTLTPLILPLAAALFYAGSSAITAALDSAVYEELLCLIFCNSEDDGSYSQAGWEALISDIDASSVINGLAGTLLRDYVGIMGSSGLTNAASYNPTATGDCDECDCVTSCDDPERFTVGTIIGSGIDVNGRQYFDVESGINPVDSSDVIIWGTLGELSSVCCTWQETAILEGSCPGSIGRFVTYTGETDQVAFESPDPAVNISAFALLQNGCPFGNPFTARITFEGCE